jgi:hypothetical protein
MSEEQKTKTQAAPEDAPDVGDSVEGGDDVAERGGGDGKAKALGSHGVGDYGRPSRRDAAE